MQIAELNENSEIWLRSSIKQEKLLRSKTHTFDIEKYDKKDLQKLKATMRKIMKRAEGIGLAANQIGIDRQFFIAEAPSERDTRSKCYIFFNPTFVKKSEETTSFEEGCLSVPNTYGSVERSEKVILEGINMYGKKVRVRAQGLLARIFQHEMDHLKGTLFIDKATDIREVSREEE